MAASSHPFDDPFSLLPDSLLAEVIIRAVSITPAALSTIFDVPAPYSHRPTSCFRALAQLRPVSTRFRNVALQVEGVFFEVDEASAVDAHVVQFLHEAQNIRTLDIAYPALEEEEVDEDDFDPPPREIPKPTVSSGFLAGALCVAPRLEHFCLSWGKLAGAGEPDHKVQFLFRSLAQCVRLECVILERCHLSIKGPICRLPASLKELHLSVIKSTSEDALVSLVQASPNLETLYLHIDGDLNVDLATTIHSQSLLRLILDYDSDRHGYDEEARELVYQSSKYVDVNTPRLEILEVNLEARKMKIDAPCLSSLTLHGDYPGDFTVAQPWHLKLLAANEAMGSDELVPLLKACRSLDVADFEYMDLDCRGNDGALILAHLKDVLELNVSAHFLTKLQADMPEDTTIPSFQKLSHLLINVGSQEEDLKVWEGFVRACPNLTCLQVEAHGRPLGKARIQELWTEELGWLEQVLDSSEEQALTESSSDESSSDA